MIKESKRIQAVQPYYFATKLAEIREMNARGLNVINLGIGSPDLPPSDQVTQRLSELVQQSDMHGYQSYTGIAELRASIANWYHRQFGVEFNPSDEVLPLIGSKEGVMHISMSFLDAGDQVLVPNPGYPAYAMAAKLAGADVKYFELDADGKWLPDFDQLEKQDLSKVKLMWLNYPNMPTGAKATAEVFARAIEFGLKNNILICHDNPYSFILTDDQLSIMDHPKAKETALELMSFSKNYNMAGWRIGAIVAHGSVIQSILKFKSNMDSGMFKPMQLAAADALSLGEEWHAGLNNTYAKRKEVALQIMDMLQCTVEEDTAGLFVWGKVPFMYTNGEELTEELLHEANVFITPGHIFGSKGSGYIRISLCATLETLEEAKSRILKFQKLMA